MITILIHYESIGIVYTLSIYTEIRAINLHEKCKLRRTVKQGDNIFYIHREKCLVTVI